MKRFYFLLPLLLTLCACAVRPPAGGQDGQLTPDQAANRITAFSDHPAGSLPTGWTPMVIFKNKKRTQYQLVQDGQATVLHAYAENASSGLMQITNIDPFAQPVLQWRWKIGNLDDAIANAQTLMEDAPARIILGFDGDKGDLSFSEQILFETAKIITGHDFPYASLMYVWDSKAPVGTVSHSKRSSRIRTIVVESGNGHVGQWSEFSRNIVADFEKAYGEKPGKLIGVGVLTDSDYSGATVETWYGDIRLTPAPQQVIQAENQARK